MSFIIKSSSPFISVRLTDLGRKALSIGSLSFNSFSISDSEVDYEREDLVNNNPSDPILSGSSYILKVASNNPNPTSFITQSAVAGPLYPLSSSNVKSIKALISNTANERGMYINSGGTYTNQTSSDYIKSYGTILNSALTGGTQVDIVSDLSIGDYIEFRFSNTTFTTGTTINPVPTLIYQIQNITGSLITVDRALPNLTGTSYSIQYIVLPGSFNYYSSASTSSYWDSGTLSFNSNNLVSTSSTSIWNMNIVRSENIIALSGTSIYKDYTRSEAFRYLGSKDYFGYNTQINTSNGTTNYCDLTNSIIDPVQKSVAIIHFTNNSISSAYGDFIFIDATKGKIFTLTIPTLLYHRSNYSSGSGTTAGFSFIGTGSTLTLPNTNINYVELIENPTLLPSGVTPNVVGKIFTDYKCVVIDDEEIITALSYKSNRNWTLPNLDATLISASGSTGVLGVGQTMYLSYVLDNDSTTGLTRNLGCQRYTKISNNTTSSKDIQFRLDGLDLLPYMRKIENVDYDGLGFYANKFKLLYQILNDETTRPLSDQWIEVDYTSPLITEVLGQTINPKLLEQQNPLSNGFILTSAINALNTGNTYNINSSLGIPLISETSKMNFGDEQVFLGNISTAIGATVYKTLISLQISDNFNTTSNKSFTIGENLRISEVGIYDTSNSLIACGKISEPITLTNSNTILLELGLDF